MLAYTDDLPFLNFASRWQALEGTFTQDMATAILFPERKLKLSTTKTISTAFLYNKKVRRELKIPIEGQTLPSCAEPTYLGIKLDRALTFRRHLESLRKKLTTCVGLLRRLARSSWVASATVLRTATLAVVHFTAHLFNTRLIDKPISGVLRLTAG